MTSRRDKLLRLLVIFGACVLLAVAAFLITNLSSAEPGPPLFGERDLPSVPADAINGWALLRDTVLPRGDDVDQAGQLSVEVIGGQLDRDRLGERVQELPKAGEPLTEALAVCTEAYQRPRFVDACPPQPDRVCPALDIHLCQRLIAYRVLVLVDADDAEAAVVLTGQLLRGGLEHAATARGFLGQMVALANLGDALDLLAELRRWLPAEAVAPVLDQLRASDPNGLRPELAIVWEYQMALNAIRMLQQGSADDDLPGWLLDEGKTRAILDEVYGSAHEGAPIRYDSQRQGLLWWFDNAVGKLLLDTLMPAGPVWDQLNKRVAEISRKRAALLEP